ncbi:MAG: hypothetical protein ABIA04_08500 [Pseudomonadota bacterium]
MNILDKSLIFKILLIFFLFSFLSCFDDSGDNPRNNSTGTDETSESGQDDSSEETANDESSETSGNESSSPDTSESSNNSLTIIDESQTPSTAIEDPVYFSGGIDIASIIVRSDIISRNDIITRNDATSAGFSISTNQTLSEIDLKASSSFKFSTIDTTTLISVDILAFDTLNEVIYKYSMFLDSNEQFDITTSLEKVQGNIIVLSVFAYAIENTSLVKIHLGDFAYINSDSYESFFNVSDNISENTTIDFGTLTVADEEKYFTSEEFSEEADFEGVDPDAGPDFTTACRRDNAKITVLSNDTYELEVSAYDPNASDISFYDINDDYGIVTVAETGEIEGFATITVDPQGQTGIIRPTIVVVDNSGNTSYWTPEIYLIADFPEEEESITLSYDSLDVNNFIYEDVTRTKSVKYGTQGVGLIYESGDGNDTSGSIYMMAFSKAGQLLSNGTVPIAPVNNTEYPADVASDGSNIAIIVDSGGALNDRLVITDYALDLKNEKEFTTTEFIQKIAVNNNGDGLMLSNDHEKKYVYFNTQTGVINDTKTIEMGENALWVEAIELTDDKTFAFVGGAVEYSEDQALTIGKLNDSGEIISWTTQQVESSANSMVKIGNDLGIIYDKYFILAYCYDMGNETAEIRIKIFDTEGNQIGASQTLTTLTDVTSYQRNERGYWEIQVEGARDGRFAVGYQLWNTLTEEAGTRPNIILGIANGSEVSTTPWELESEISWSASISPYFFNDGTLSVFYESSNIGIFKVW